MSNVVQGLPGGGIFSLTTTETVIDLSTLAGYEVFMGCDTQQLLFSFSLPTSTVTTLTTTATAASITTLVADMAGAGTKVRRQILNSHTRLVAKLASGTGFLVVKPISVLK